MSVAVEEDDDVALLDRWQAGDAGAGEVLFARHQEALRAFFRSRGRRTEEADDLVQLTLLAFLEAKDRFRRDSSVRTFLIGIAQRQLAVFVRRALRDPRVLSFLQEDPASPLTQLATVELEARLRRALQRIPPELATVLELHYWRGLTAGQIAVRLELPSGTVASRLRRAKARVRELLQADSRP